MVFTRKVKTVPKRVKLSNNKKKLYKQFIGDLFIKSINSLQSVAISGLFESKGDKINF